MIVRSQKGEDNNQAPSGPNPPWIGIAVLSVIAVQVGYGILVFYLSGPSMDARGQFGDMFGGVNALFTGLAFAGVIYTILLQRKELELQREELRLGRAELRRSAEAQIGSQKTLTEQADLLRESANLSAMTTLVNVYGRMLEPYWEGTRNVRMEIDHIKNRLMEIMDFEEHNRLDSELRTQKDALASMERSWSDTLEKHASLVSALEELTNQVAATPPADTDK